MSKPDKVLSMIGICTKAGKVKSGEFAVEAAIKDQKAQLVVVATDASEATKKSYRDSCDHYRVDLREYGTKEELGMACGKEFRAAVAIMDRGMADSVIAKMEEQIWQK